MAAEKLSSEVCFKLSLLYVYFHISSAVIFLCSQVPCNQTPLTSKRGDVSLLFLPASFTLAECEKVPPVCSSPQLSQCKPHFVNEREIKNSCAHLLAGGKERSLFEDIVSRESKNQAGTISTVGWKSSTLSSGSNTTKVTLHARASEELEAKGTNSMAFSGSYPWSQNDSKSKHIQRLEDSSSCSFSHNSSNKSTKNEGGDCKRMVLPAYQKASEEPSKSNKAKTHLVFQGREVKPSMTYAQEMCKPYETLQKSAVASTSVQTECSASEILDKVCQWGLCF